MKRLVVFLMLLLWGLPAMAVEVAGVKLTPQVQVAGETLKLNGYGIRKKFFFKIYVGSLYTAQPVRTAEEVLAAPGAKLIRMDFLYSKVKKEKIVDAFAEGFAKNSPALMDSVPAKTFLHWFDADFVEGDRVDLLIAADGTVSASHNGRKLGELHSPELARGVLLIYLGQKPADEDLKEGMLGG
ncbi:chalcone isomerase-like protein [Geothermobacter ehrlichii]|uniref:Chalcone isomerase-like protein n=1 Tax=Geothermobacter ehrlichii TaxID=213224 RepID=A0A5D3WHI4_9BACT|nr:chalcone isomerase family protein [Geothermobacter ehrlichii]TYO95822.1 chalcone isomerase-like protein [Geothermobacter ehrlichii]